MSCGSAPFSFHEPNESISVSVSPPPGTKLKTSTGQKSTTDADAAAEDVHKDAPSSSSIMVKSYEKTRLTNRENGDKDKQEEDEKHAESNHNNDIDIDITITVPDEDVHKLRLANAEDRLSILPDELILRIISLSGSPTHQMRTAFALGNTCRRLRRVLLTAYLPSLHRFTQDSLNALGLSDTQRATQALRAVLDRTCSIRTLSLEGPPPQVFTAGCFLALSTAAKENLRSVNLAYSYLSDDCVKPLLANCTQLEELSLCSCSKMTGEAFNSNNIRAPIKLLDLSFMHLLDVNALKSVAHLETITGIKLAGCSNVNNNALTSLSQGNVKNSIRSINLKCCPVDDETIIAFVLRCKKLRELVLAKHHDNLWETGYYTEAAVMFIRERLPAVQVVIEN